jgi:hypothetical protein
VSGIVLASVNLWRLDDRCESAAERLDEEWPSSELVSPLDSRGKESCRRSTSASQGYLKDYVSKA